MIHDSFDYKDDLVAELTAVERGLEDPDKASQAVNPGLRLERFVFWTAFITRKMSEANKLSDQLEGTEFKLAAYPRSAYDGLQDFMNWDKVDRFYDLEGATATSRQLKWICNQLIHSFVWMPAFTHRASEDRLHGFLFNSDVSRAEALFFIDWQEFRRLVHLVASDDVVSLHVDRIKGNVEKSHGSLPD